jgi:hypothetical protein
MVMYSPSTFNTVPVRDSVPVTGRRESEETETAGLAAFATPTVANIPVSTMAVAATTVVTLVRAQCHVA